MNDVISETETPATDWFAAQVRPLQINQRTHYAAAESYQRRHFVLGLAVVVISTAVGAFSFANLSAYGDWTTNALSAGSLFSALLAAIVTFASFSDWSARHQKSAVQYGRLLRDARSRISGVFTEGENAAFVPAFKAEWDEISAHAPITFFKGREEVAGRTDETGA